MLKKLGGSIKKLILKSYFGLFYCLSSILSLMWDDDHERTIELFKKIVVRGEGDMLSFVTGIWLFRFSETLLLRIWIGQYKTVLKMDGIKSRARCNRLLKFITMWLPLCKVDTFKYKKLLRNINMILNGNSNKSVSRVKLCILRTLMKDQHTSSSSSLFNIDRIPPKQIASYLVNADIELMSQITPYDTINKLSSYNRAIEYFNKVSYWIKTIIMKSTTDAERLKWYNYFVNVANLCRHERDYNMVMSIISAFGDINVSRVYKHLIQFLMICKNLCRPRKIMQTT